MDSSGQKLTSEALCLVEKLLLEGKRSGLYLPQRPIFLKLALFCVSVIFGPLFSHLDPQISRAARLVGVLDDINDHSKWTTEDGTELFVVTFKTPDIITHITLIPRGNVFLDLGSPSIRHVLSRRGSSQVSFTATELCELLNLPAAPMDLILSSFLANSTNSPEFSPKIHLKDARRRDTKNGFDRHVVGIPIGLFCVSFRHHLALRTSRITDGSYDPSVSRTRNVSGRMYDVSGGLRSVYTSGWAANRARGVLTSAMYGAYSVAATLVTDRFSGEAGGGAGRVVGDPGVSENRDGS
ncbi:hypothetical protein BS47DRAFT_1397314 [Hydnum rufescens UP504]|uniref:Uncharacterized protein n=1 Tax=Hydnum rufescens UP504 TaxID=1448309 RepID=A0A9P6APA4_9AGAM|nr:hypothetical protein BS47DRAFT_1397314 [Hydnum rufescens UP504]